MFRGREGQLIGEDEAARGRIRYSEVGIGARSRYGIDDVTYETEMGLLRLPLRTVS